MGAAKTKTKQKVFVTGVIGPDIKLNEIVMFYRSALAQKNTQRCAC